MSLYAAHTDTTTADILIAQLKVFAEANGWTVVYYGTYNSHNRLHLLKNGCYFAFWYAEAYKLYVGGHTGFDSALGPGAQPGMSGVVYWGVGASGNCDFISTPYAIYFRYLTVDWNNNRLVGFGMIPAGDKIGSWTGGAFITGFDDSGARNGSFTAYPAQYYNNGGYVAWSSFYINGAWSTLACASAGAVVSYPCGVRGEMPFYYNMGVLPFPLLAARLNSVNTTYLHPVAWFPDLYVVRGGDVYGHLDEVTVGADTMLMVSLSGDSSPSFSPAAAMFRLGL